MLVAWTTTPWTLPSNVALCVNPEMDYCKVRDNKTGAVYVMMEKRIVQIFPPTKAKKKKKKKKGGEEEAKAAAAPAEPYTILEKMKGKALVGLRYKPLFEYLRDSLDAVASAANPEVGAWRVVSDDYVTDESGTGIVHQAPAFGEDDYRVCLAHKIIKEPSEGG